jgi:hypothetical protein
MKQKRAFFNSKPLDFFHFFKINLFLGPLDSVYSSYRECGNEKKNQNLPN